MEEGKKTGYILKDDKIIALIGYREQPDFKVVSIKKMDSGITAYRLHPEEKMFHGNEKIGVLQRTMRIWYNRDV